MRKERLKPGVQRKVALSSESESQLLKIYRNNQYKPLSELAVNFFTDLLRFHGWANQRLIRLADDLNDEALDASAPLGPGSLRATFVHIFGAQRIWLDRWKNLPSAPFPTGEGWSLQKIRNEFETIDSEFEKFIHDSASLGLDRWVDYENLKRERYQQRLSDLLLHVLNHAVHHRSQALNFLKRQGRTLPGGLDYIFYKLAHPTILQPNDVAEVCRKYGIETGSVAVEFQAPDIDLIARYQQYGDWALQRLLDEARTLSNDQLDRDWSMGHGSLRKTLLHLYDAEIWWQSNWQDKSIPFPKSPSDTSIDTLSSSWRAMASNRTRLLAEIGQAGLGRAVTANFGSGPLQFRISDSMLQLCVHGTLHRAQSNNMLRSLGRAVQPLDYVVYIREAPKASA